MRSHECLRPLAAWERFSRPPIFFHRDAARRPADGPEPDRPVKRIDAALAAGWDRT